MDGKGKLALQAKSQKEGGVKEEEGCSVEDGLGCLLFTVSVSLHTILLSPWYIFRRMIVYCI